MSQTQPSKGAPKKLTWLRVATRGKWVGNLFLALAAAAIFAGLGQWQLSRTLVSAPTPSPTQSTGSQQVAAELTSVATPNSILSPSAYDKLVRFEATCDSTNPYIIRNRVQLLDSGAGQTGFWITRKCVLADQSVITVADYWVADLAAAEGIREELISNAKDDHLAARQGILEPGEPLVQTKDLGDLAKGRPYLLGSISSPQLLNLYSPDAPLEMYDGVVIGQDLTPLPGTEKIRIGMNRQTPLDINWLNAFYALEWAFFAGFAIFLWWRLVEDERQRELAAARQHLN